MVGAHLQEQVVPELTRALLTLSLWPRENRALFVHPKSLLQQNYFGACSGWITWGHSQGDVQFYTQERYLDLGSLKQIGASWGWRWGQQRQWSVCKRREKRTTVESMELWHLRDRPKRDLRRSPTSATKPESQQPRGGQATGQPVKGQCRSASLITQARVANMLAPQLAASRGGTLMKLRAPFGWLPTSGQKCLNKNPLCLVKTSFTLHFGQAQSSHCKNEQRKITKHNKNIWPIQRRELVS